MPRSIYVLLWYRGEDTMYSEKAIFWTVMLQFPAFFVESLSLFFLTLDRFLFIIWPKYALGQHQIYVVIPNIACQAIAYLLDFIVYSSYLDFSLYTGKITACYTYICFDRYRAKTDSWKYIITLDGISISAGGTFCYFYSRYRKLSKAKGSKHAYSILVYALATEFTFKLVPQFLNFNLLHIFNIVIEDTIGPYMSYVQSLEMSCRAIFYIYVYSRYRAKKKHTKSSIKVVPTPT
ncbi:unnamed protein product [Bursaphelenchus okinawaensis]|uniref:Uncharacterized protein n=1 Tax=Bursaphelenchus okinawaensis TaxID=465554 RepID=A0A811LGT2_9BILA|nr:unnamed protein product [Bursaphelenchus okinawaensis]CAG9123533.1 unnamed protein product [Bursaphelenchus okinawaensis]